MATAEEVRELLLREPFEPFRIHLTSGDAYEVYDPLSIALMKNRLLVVLPGGERSAICPYIHIAAIETLRAA